MTEPEILTIGWPEIVAWLRGLARESQFDTIVGITRCGLPLAVALSAMVPEASLAILSRRGPRGAKPPCYDFETDRAERVVALDLAFELTSLPQSVSKVLIIDDVATYGDTLAMAMSKVRSVAPDAEIGFACYAADEARLRAGRPEILERLHRHIVIDNARTWVSFPWNLEPVA